LCNNIGGDLLQVSSSAEEKMILEALGSRPAYSQLVMPGYFHLGLYQRRSAVQFYHRNGLRV
jgi:hypothetical protein